MHTIARQHGIAVEDRHRAVQDLSTILVLRPRRAPQASHWATQSRSHNSSSNMPLPLMQLLRDPITISHYSEQILHLTMSSCPGEVPASLALMQDTSPPQNHRQPCEDPLPGDASPKARLDSLRFLRHKPLHSSKAPVPGTIGAATISCACKHFDDASR